MANRKQKIYASILIALIVSTFSIGSFDPLFSLPSLKNFNNNSNIIPQTNWSPPMESPDNYAAALQKAIYFYQQQRSGDLPDNNTVIWRGDSCLNDGSDVGKDLIGGYFDDDGYVKSGLPLASTIATLAWAVYEYEDVFNSIGQLDEILDTIKWGTDYILKCHTAPNEYYFQVGNPNDDYAWWGPVEVVDKFLTRPSYKIDQTNHGSTVAAATAAALVFSSIVFEVSNPGYAAKLLSHAQDLYTLAWTSLSDNYYNSYAGDYSSKNGFWDELSAAGILLYNATHISTYLDDAQQAVIHWKKDNSDIKYTSTHTWDDMHYLAQILLFRETGNQTYKESIERNLDWWVNGANHYTPGGLAYYRANWGGGEGTLRFAANEAFLAAVWSDDPNCTQANVPIYQDFYKSQINYILGNNTYGTSYLIGFGNSYWQKIRHSTAHGSWNRNIDDPINNSHIIYGALVSGPADGGDFWINDRSVSTTNRVALDYNSGLIGALAKMTELYGGTPHTDFPGPNWFIPKNTTGLEYYCNARLIVDEDIVMQFAGDLSNHATWPAKVGDNLSYRYFFNLSEVFEANYTIANISILPQSSEVPVTVSGLIHLFNDTYYIIVDYTGSSIYPGDETKAARESQIRIELPSGAPPSAWDPTNDWSFQGLNSNPIPSEFIPVYDNDTLIFGQEPLEALYSDPPAAPTGLTAEPYNGTSIQLDWKDNLEPDFNNYRVYRSTTPGFDPNGNLIAVTSISEYFNLGLDNGTTYYYKVIAVDFFGNPSSPSLEVNTTTFSDKTPPSAPIGLTVQTYNDTRIDLDWDNNSEPDINIYRVYRSITQGFTPSISNLISETINSDYNDTDLTPNTTYYYRVVAVDIYGNPSTPSSEVNDTTASDSIPPASPTGLNTNVIDTSSILLNWDDNSDPDFNGYRIYRGTTSGFTPDLSTNIANNTVSYYLDIGLTPDTTYYYQVIAVDLANNLSPPSSEVNDTTNPDITPPVSPNGFTVLTYNDTRIDLDWNNNLESDFDIYWIYRDTAPEFAINISTNIANTTDSFYYDIGLTPETTYYYRIVAVDIYGNPSFPSIELYNITDPDITPPAAPTGLEAFVYDSSRIFINWTDNPELDLDLYRIYRSITPGFTPNSTYFIAETYINEFLNFLLYQDTTYYFCVIAVDIYGNPSTSSIEVNATTDIDTEPPASPTGVTTSLFNQIEVFLDWDDNSEIDFVKYLVYRSLQENFIQSESTLIAETNISEYLDTNVTIGNTYYYLIIAVDVNDYPSDPSYKTSVTIPGAIGPELEDLILLVTIIAIIVLTLVGSVYVLVNRRKEKIPPITSSDKPKDHKIFVKSEVDVLDNSRLIQIFEEEELLRRIDQFKDIRITILQEDFLENIEKLSWDNEYEKKEFIKEMLILSPNERQRIIKEMLNDFYQ